MNARKNSLSKDEKLNKVERQKTNEKRKNFAFAFSGLRHHQNGWTCWFKWLAMDLYFTRYSSDFTWIRHLCFSQ